MEYIDLGLPSGNLWAVENEDGYYTFDEAVAKFRDDLPTKEDFDELIAHCWKRWNSERKGMEFMGDNGVKLFLPASFYNQGIHDVPNVSTYWSATAFNDRTAYNFSFSSNGIRNHNNCGKWRKQSIHLIYKNDG